MPNVVQREHCATVERRTARKRRVCDDFYAGPRHFVEPGEVYLLHKAFPGHDANSSDRIWTLSECSSCATKYRAHLLVEPVIAPARTPTEGAQ